MQLLAPPVQAIAADNRVNAGVSVLLEILAEAAEVIVGYANVEQFARDELNNDHVVKIANDGNIIGKNILRIRKIDERRQQSFPVFIGKLPFIIGQHAEQRLQFGDALANKVR